MWEEIAIFCQCNDLLWGNSWLNSLSWLNTMLLQVLVSGAGSEATAAPGCGLPGAGDLAGVSGRGSTELHQPGLAQLRAHQPEPQRPRTIQLRGCSGGLSHSFFTLEVMWTVHVMHTWTNVHARLDKHLQTHTVQACIYMYRYHLDCSSSTQWCTI